MSHAAQRISTWRVWAALETGGPNEIATMEELCNLEALVIDVRDASEIDNPLPLVPGSVNIPLNMDGRKQLEHVTTLEEYKAKLDASGALLADKSAPIVTCCGGQPADTPVNSRGLRVKNILKELGYTNVVNGGTPNNIIDARGSGDGPECNTEECWA